MPNIDPAAAPAEVMDLRRRIDKLEGAVRFARSAIGNLARATIGRGGLTIEDGGAITVKGGGGLSILDGGWLMVRALGRVVSIGASTLSHLADGRVWCETLVDPTNPLAGGTTPRTLLQPAGLTAFDTNPSSWVALTCEPGGRAKVWSTANALLVPYTTTSAGANTRMESDGQLRMVTSSRRYKQDIADAVIDATAVLQLRGRTWRQRSEVEEDPATQSRYIGFIAEELHDLGLIEFVDYDDQGRPDAIQYDRVSVALLEVVKDLAARVSALEQPQPPPT